MSDPSADILQSLRASGYFVSVHHLPRSLLGTIGAFVEMHAVRLDTHPAQQHIARVPADEGSDADYRCACLLAEMVGMQVAD